MKMGQVETFATIQTNGNVRGGLHAVSSGANFCVATCQDQVGCIDLTWFLKSTPETEATEQNSANHLTSATAKPSEENKAAAASQNSGERIEQKSRVRVQAHENNIACLAMN